MNIESFNTYNTKLSKLLKSLKKDCQISNIRQNYRGTGSQKYRRQIFLRFDNGDGIDIWLEAEHMEFGGVLNRGGLPERIWYEETPEQTCEKIREAIMDRMVREVMVG